MKRRDQRILFSQAGTVCPLCGGRVSRGVYFCSRCGRSGRLQVEPGEIKQTRRSVYIPRELTR